MNKTQNYDIVKFIDGEFELEVSVSPEEDTIWLTQEQIVFLFNSTKQNISMHINNILGSNELSISTVKEILTVRYEGKRKVKRKINHYNLDMIISIGYRVNSKRGIMFRQWANKVLKEYLLKGYVINENRVIVSNDNYIELKNQVTSINNRLIKIEDKVLDKEFSLNKIFYNGEFYDSYTLIQSIFESANNEIIIIDNYTDRTVIDRLIVKKE
ncbi:MAG: virulence RhuM family protein, partial [Bacilli bacterium]|nr:virulence RhuM family protein [Bacilli bacterium]